MEGKDAKSIIKRKKTDKHDRHGKHRNQDAGKKGNKVRQQTNKVGVREGRMQVWIGCP